jgi:Transglutaminase-like superfamily
MRAAAAPAMAYADPHRPWTPAERVALTAEIASSYVRARWWLRRVTVAEAARLARNGREAPSLTGRHRGEYELAWRLGGIVERNLGRLPGDTRCLTRSLVLLAMLARRGMDARLVIGVRSGEAFAAHAWVELDGHPMLLTGGDFQAGRLTEI